MANFSYLYASEVGGPPDPDDDRTLATGRYFLPAFWIASCSLENLESYVDEDDERTTRTSTIYPCPLPGPSSSSSATARR